MRWRWVALFLVACVLGCSRKADEGPKGGGGKERRSVQFPVEVTSVQARPVEYVVSAVGSVEAFERIQVSARVAGVVEKVSFREGDTVTEGKPLLEIEPARFRLQAAAARAALRKAGAAQADARAGLTRRESANAQNPGLIPAEDVETFRTRSLAGEADVAEKKVALERALLDQKDAYVRAPKAGVIQTRSVETGQYVQPGTVLATLLRRDPLLLRFQVPEGEAARIKPGLAARFKIRELDRTFTSRIVHVAEAADPKTRMLAMTAEIDDPERQALRPGAFAEVSVQIGEARDSPVIPQTGVRPSEKGFLAYVVEDGVARERVLTLGLRTVDGLVEVRSGVKPGETLVIRGAEALRDGAPVKVAGGAPAAPAKGTP